MLPYTQNILVAAPVPNDNIIGSASNVSTLAALQAQVNALQIKVNALTASSLSTSTTTGSLLGSGLGVPLASSQSIGMLTFSTTANIPAVSDFGTFTDFIYDISGSFGVTTPLTIDLSGFGIQSNIAATSAATFQSGHIQILWPPVAGIVHQVGIAAPFSLIGGSSTVTVATPMTLFRYVVAPASAIYPTEVTVTQAQRTVYLVPVAP